MLGLAVRLCVLLSEWPRRYERRLLGARWIVVDRGCCPRLSGDPIQSCVETDLWSFESYAARR